MDGTPITTSDPTCDERQATRVEEHRVTLCRVFLLRLGQRDVERRVFYVERTRRTQTHRASARGPRLWLTRLARKWEALIRSSGEQGDSRIRRYWLWLQRFRYADELTLRRLRAAGVIEVYYPSLLELSEARELWTGYLDRRAQRHLLWFLFNLGVSPITLLTVPLPGPNVLGYWFVYRAVCHLLALLGIQRARGCRAETRYQASDLLNEVLEEPGGAVASRIMATFGLRGLVKYLRRALAERPEGGAEAQVVGGRHVGSCHNTTD